ncbi:ABC transporter substrate-binding protein [Bradyrhizobium prioriisuperbiae]|uniref:cytochrome c/ABC transporter substrate-binding protein n=1 Tax=Bradyrhizobium prioriisuperbiae TaxID=2854389 RepID=UPI0028ED294F|nr:ABC transporter substrate-binding protein [Bradyrhizobium prioritasuperba]
MRRALAITVVALAITTGLASAADNQPTSGQRIFRFGGDAGEVRATFAASNAMLPPVVRRCAGCHGADGAGTREGGVPTPPISWAALAVPRAPSPARPGRPGYDEATLKRALTEGIDAAGRPLAAGMPRFQLSPTQVTALLDYLRIVGTDADLDPGVSVDEIRVGAVLPLSGSQAAWGQAMHRGLEAALAAAGPIYGRRLRIVAVDAGNDVSATFQRLAASDQVFAMVATLLPGREAAGEIEDVPVVGPLAPTPAQLPANQFHLLAPVEDQMRVLVDELASETPRSLRLAVIGPEGAVADAVADQARRNGATIVRRTTSDDLAAVLPPAIAPAPDAVVVLPGVDLNHLVAELAGRSGDWRLAGLAEAVTLRGAMDERLRLVLPLLPHDPRQRETSAAAMEIPPLAAASAAVLVEGVKRMGARASRAGLIAAIETVRDFPTAVLPPVSFGRGQHAGTRASVMIRPDNSRGIVVLGDWRAPR